jgi:hypothetical protein
MKRLRIATIIATVTIIAIGSAAAYAMNQYMNKLPVKEYFNDEKTNAIWDWTNPISWQDKNLESYAKSLKIHQINTIYVDISILADILSGQNSSERIQQEAKLSSALEEYTKTMNNNGISVYAASGNTDWSKPELQYIPLGIQQFVFNHNKIADNKVDGIEFDIESYNQDGFSEASMTEKSLVLMEYMDMVDKLVIAHKSHLQENESQKLGLGFAIPYWLDNENNNIKSINWQGKTGPTLFHLLDRLQTLPDTNVAVMAYRNAASGNDGMLYHSRTELDYAQARANNVDVLIGVETTNVEPEKITFFKKSKTELSNEVRIVNEELSSYSVYGGIAINDLMGFMELPE